MRHHTFRKRLFILFAAAGFAWSCGGNTPTQPGATDKTAAPPAPASSGFSFVSSTPAPGGETNVTSSDGSPLFPELQMTLSVMFDQALPDAKVEIDLLDAGGANCWYTFQDHPLPASVAQTITVGVYPAVWVQGYPLAGTCGTYPHRIASVRATLLTLRGPEVNGHLQRTDYVTQLLPVGYTVQRYPAPPPAAPPAALTISSFRWSGPSIPTDGDPPMADDPVSAVCIAREADGAPITITLTLTWDGLPPQTSTKAFPAGVSSSAEGAIWTIGSITPRVSRPHALVACAASNARGDLVRQSLDIGVAPK